MHYQKKENNSRVLVVDDEEDVLDFLRIFLGSLGWDITTASTIPRAFEALESRSYFLVLTDVAMPEMDGYQVLAAIAEDPALRTIPAVVLSARDPAGQPIVSNALAVTRGGKLSMPQLLACSEALSRILGTMREAGDAKRRT